MAYTAPTTDDVCPQGLRNAYGVFRASGSVSKAQIVKASGDQTVEASDDTIEWFGIAANDASDGDDVAVYGAGSIVNTKISGTVSPGTAVGPNGDGAFHDGATHLGGICVSGSVTGSVDTGQVLIMGGKTFAT